MGLEEETILNSIGRVVFSKFPMRLPNKNGSVPVDVTSLMRLTYTDNNIVTNGVLL